MVAQWRSAQQELASRACSRHDRAHRSHIRCQSASWTNVAMRFAAPQLGRRPSSVWISCIKACSSQIWLRWGCQACVRVAVPTAGHPGKAGPHGHKLPHEVMCTPCRRSHIQDLVLACATSLIYASLQQFAVSKLPSHDHISSTVAARAAPLHLAHPGGRDDCNYRALA